MNENLLPVTEKHFKDLRLQIIEFKKINTEIVFDYHSKKGEKDARSHIYKMRQSKSEVSKRHKEKKADVLKVSQELDAAKRELISEIDEMIEYHSKPLKEIEEQREKEAAYEKMLIDWDDAIKENEIFDREREIARKEAYIKRQEEERLEKIRLEKEKAEAERLRIEREEQIRKEAIEKIEREKIEAELKLKQEKERAEREKIEAELKLKQEQENAKIAAEKAELKRLADIKEEKERAEKEKQDAIAKAKFEQEEKERIERERIEKEKTVEAARIANIEHRKRINNIILKQFIDAGIDEKSSIKIITLIAKCQISNISINY